MQKKRRNGRASTETSFEDEIAHLRGPPAASASPAGAVSGWRVVRRRSSSTCPGSAAPPCRPSLALSAGKPNEADDEDLKGDDRKEAEKNNEAARLWISGLEAVNRKLDGPGAGKTEFLAQRAVHLLETG